tara:strand:+ start:5949 stop:6629 length:681 start_codon:yes stop_codon:yes gene_type:complete
MSDTLHAFDRVYKTHKWGVDGGGSGLGSTLRQSSGAARILFHVVLSFNIHTIVDAACGAMVWQRELLPQLFSAQQGLRYIGIDAAKTVVDANRQTFRKSHPQVQFQHSALETISIPPTDLIFSRDTLQHNSLRGVAQILQRFVQSNASHILTTSFPNGSHYCKGLINRPIETGDFFCIDLAREPFSMRPLAMFEEVAFDKKWLYLFERTGLQRGLNNMWPRFFSDS